MHDTGYLQIVSDVSGLPVALWSDHSLWVSGDMAASRPCAADPALRARLERGCRPFRPAIFMEDAYVFWELLQIGSYNIAVGPAISNTPEKGYGQAYAAATRSWDGFQGIVLRLSLDVMTGGASEVVMAAPDVNRAAVDYRKATGGNGTTSGYFKVMALPIALAVVPGGVTKYGKKVIGRVGKVANYIAPNKTAALMSR